MALSPMTTTFTPQSSGGAYGINAYGPGYIEVNGQRHDQPLILHPEQGVTPLNDATVSTITAAHLEQVAAHMPEVVLVGTGERQVFLGPQVLAPLQSARVGVECMSLAAACRTFNLLAAEGRKTVAVLLFR
ncbi:MAG: hypothetical protein RLZZ281_395 [Pseudomonadota bacterium]